MLSAIVALSKNHVIGNDNKLLWHLPKDLEHFKKTTSGHTIIMGRKTFESLGRVLPNRHHVILTQNKQYHVDHPDVTVIHSVVELFSMIKTNEEFFVIGGGEIYKLLLPLCETLYITKINKNFKGDTTFPVYELQEWIVVKEEKGIIDEENTLSHTFMTLKRK